MRKCSGGGEVRVVSERLSVVLLCLNGGVKDDGGREGGVTCIHCL